MKKSDFWSFFSLKTCYLIKKTEDITNSLFSQIIMENQKQKENDAILYTWIDTLFALL